MILVDTSVWVDHLRHGDRQLVALLQNGQALAHPWVTGERALGHLLHRREILGLLGQLPQAGAATDLEVLAMIDNHQLFGVGIGHVDAHLLAAAMLTTGARLWTHDERLAAAADQLRLASRNGQLP